MEFGKDMAQSLHSLAEGIATPENLFAGLRSEQGLSPDNIILFRRTSTEAFKQTEMINNYHHRFELVVVLEQGGTVRIGERSYSLEPGDCALIFPHQFHHYMDVSSGSIEWIFITFEVENPGPIALLRDNPRRLDAGSVKLLEDIVRSYLRGLPTDPLGVAFNLSLLLSHLVDAPLIPEERRSLHSADDTRDVIVERISKYVRQNLKKAITLEDLAEELGYSASYLRTTFHEKLGVTLGRYLRESRLAQAARLLLGSEKSISQIAKETGFGSANAFSRAFVNYSGMPPKAYAQKFGSEKKA